MTRAQWRCRPGPLKSAGTRTGPDRAPPADPHLRWHLPSIRGLPGECCSDCAARVTQSSHAQIVVEPGRVRVISVVDEARLEPQVVGEYIDWRAATETELS